ncbi:hypothetical protein NSPZN2_70125 [Nitrospira defluvii]|uniref:Transposase n=1 Tax=Nitrospira defluvii TaxID=330214 RepID=A0ABM8S9R8_9BACT|nr:hypothetical protein NSPZN2_70125 [Nitrospira defluvii]
MTLMTYWLNFGTFHASVLRRSKWEPGFCGEMRNALQSR